MALANVWLPRLSSPLPTSWRAMTSAQANGTLSAIWALGQRMGQRFDAVETRVGALERISSADSSKIADLHAWVRTLNGRLTELDSTF